MLVLTDDDVRRFTSVRRKLHTIPELAYEEHKTAAVIREELATLGVRILPTLPDTPTAVVAMIGDETKPCVALRADIDALPIVEATDHDYPSTHDGRMHACGHDGHAATLLATAAVLKRHEATLPVCVKLIFQPAEEGGGGGERLCDAGVLDGRLGPKVSRIYGLHGWPGLPVGVVSTRPGPLLAATDTFECSFVGVGCHGAFPHWGRDPIVPACEAVVSLQAIVTRELDPTEPAIVTVGQINAGTTTNVIPDRCTIRGTIRTLAADVREKVCAAVERRCRAVAEAAGCSVEFTRDKGYPPVINDPASAERVAMIAQQAVGAANYFPAARPAMGGEDFAYYLEHVPGCFFLIGVRPRGRESYPSLHNDHFDFTDDALATGVAMFTRLVEAGA